MSHLTSINIEIKNLAALKEAVKELGFQFVEGKTSYKWYGAHVGDYPVPEGMTKDQLGKCQHVVKVPGVEYEIGVVKKPNGNWTLAYDFWGPGRELQKAVPKLTQMYGVHAATIEAKRKGYTVQRALNPNGSIRLTIGGRM